MVGTMMVFGGRSGVDIAADGVDAITKYGHSVPKGAGRKCLSHHSSVRGTMGSKEKSNSAQKQYMFPHRRCPGRRSRVSQIKKQ